MITPLVLLINGFVKAGIREKEGNLAIELGMNKASLTCPQNSNEFDGREDEGRTPSPSFCGRYIRKVIIRKLTTEAPVSPLSPPFSASLSSLSPSLSLSVTLPLSPCHCRSLLSFPVLLICLHKLNPLFFLSLSLIAHNRLFPLQRSKSKRKIEGIAE